MFDILAPYLPMVLASLPGVFALGAVWFVNKAKDDGKDDWKDEVVRQFIATKLKVEEKLEEDA